MVFAFLVIPMVSAATTLVAPIDNSNHTGTIALVNCTTDVANALTAAIWYNATGVSDAILTTVANTSTGQTVFSEASVDVSSLTDVADYDFWCAVVGDSSENSTVKSSITVDNTDPVVTLFVDLSGETQSYGRGVDYSCTTTDGIDSSPTEVFSVAHPTGDTPTSTSLNLQSTKLFFVDTDYEGDFVFTCTSTDYTGNSDSSTATVTVDASGKAIRVQSNDSNTWMYIVLGIVLIWLVNNARKK